MATPVQKNQTGSLRLVDSRDEEQKRDHAANRGVFVSNLPTDTFKKDLFDMAIPYGGVEKIIFPHQGWAIIIMGTHDEATRVLQEMDNRLYKGSSLEASWARSREAQKINTVSLFAQETLCIKEDENAERARFVDLQKTRADALAFSKPRHSPLPIVAPVLAKKQTKTWGDPANHSSSAHFWDTADRLLHMVDTDPMEEEVKWHPPANDSPSGNEYVWSMADGPPTPFVTEPYEPDVTWTLPPPFLSAVKSSKPQTKPYDGVHEILTTVDVKVKNSGLSLSLKVPPDLFAKYLSPLIEELREQIRKE
jgi:RNA recognition motif-containing protein